MKTLCQSTPPGGIRTRDAEAFTMIEIAISLAVIAFALVAIIGILPTGMSAQRENREDTIINQDASIFLQALRSGETGLDDLTNSVVVITNWRTTYEANGTYVDGPFVHWHNYTNSSDTPKLYLTNGFRIVGLLTTPKYINITLPNKQPGYISNYTMAIVRSMSGLASEKSPQTNSEVRELSLTYRLLPDVLPYTEFDTNRVYYADPQIAGNLREITTRSNAWREMANLQTNLWDVRLRFQWPLLASGKVGDGRQVYRSMVSGNLFQTNDFVTGHPLYLFKPRTYVSGQ